MRYDKNRDGQFSSDEVKAIVEDLVAEKETVTSLARELMMEEVHSHTQTYKCVCGFFGLALYCFLGAGVFQLLERPTESKYVIFMNKEIENLNTSLARFEDIVTVCQDPAAAQAALNETGTLIFSLVEEPPDLNNLNWNFPSAVFFATTLVSTIGYGSFCAVTTAGRAWTVMFSTIGIVYFAFVLTLTSERLVRMVNFTTGKILSKGNDYYMSSGTGAFALALISCVYILFVSAMASVMNADWEFGDSMYFSCITFTTIGLGDFAPSADPERDQFFNAFKFFTFSVFTLVGMSLISALLQEVSDYIVHRSKLIRAQLELKAKKLLLSKHSNSGKNSRVVRKMMQSIHEKHLEVEALKQEQYMGDDIHHATAKIGILPGRTGISRTQGNAIASNAVKDIVEGDCIGKIKGQGDVDDTIDSLFTTDIEDHSL